MAKKRKKSVYQDEMGASSGRRAWRFVSLQEGQEFFDGHARAFDDLMERTLFEVFGMERNNDHEIVLHADIVASLLSVEGEAHPFEGGHHISGRHRRKNDAHKLTHISVMCVESGRISPPRSLVTSR